MAPYDFLQLIALCAFCSLVPAGNVSRGTKHKDGIGLDPVYQQTDLLGLFSQYFIGQFALGDVPRRDVGELLRRYGTSIPGEPPIGTVLAQETVFEGNGGCSGALDSRSVECRQLAISRMDDSRLGL